MQRCALASPAARALRLDAQKNRRLQRKALPAPLDDRIDMLRPIVQHTWIDVRTVRPDNRAQIFVYSGLPEQVQIAQWAKKRAEQDRIEVDGAFGAVIEFHGEYIVYTEVQALSYVPTAE